MAARKNIMLGTAGHVDHGKTALVKLLTGCDTDTLAEERARGLTIDLGFAPCHLPGNRVVGIVDVPGHVDFIRHMVAGAHGIDLVMLVVAADDGVMPQTREHLDILTLMGVRHGLVALTKIDLVEPARRQQVASDIRRLLAGTFLEEALICPLSNVTGEGFDAFYEALDAAITAREDRPAHGLFRAWVADVFTIRGFGTVVTGIPSSGRVRVGQPLWLVPGGEAGRIRRLEVYGEDATEGRAGECVAMNLPDLDHLRVKRGTLVTDSDAVAPVGMVEAEFRLLGTVTGQLADYAEVHLHIGTASSLAHLAFLESDTMNAGESQMIQLRMTEPLGIVPGDRFVVRASLQGADQNKLTTIGGGQVLAVSNIKLRRRRPRTMAALRARRDVMGDPPRWSAQLLRESLAPLPLSTWARRCFRPETDLRADADALVAQGLVVRSPGGDFVHAETVGATAELLRAAIALLHEAHPKRMGFAQPEIVEVIARANFDAAKPCRPVALGSGNTRTTSKPSERPKSTIADAVFQMAADRLVKDGQLEQRGDLLAKAGWQPLLSTGEEQVAERIAARLREARFSPPRAEEMSPLLGLPAERVSAAVRLLAERGELVVVAPGLLFHREAVAAAEEVALQLFARAPSFTTMEFRDALGVSRKFAVPLLDYLDSRKCTVRSGNTRTPGVAARARLHGSDGM